MPGFPSHSVFRTLHRTCGQFPTQQQYLQCIHCAQKKEVSGSPMERTGLPSLCTNRTVSTLCDLCKQHPLAFLRGSESTTVAHCRHFTLFPICKQMRFFISLVCLGILPKHPKLGQCILYPQWRQRPLIPSCGSCPLCPLPLRRPLFPHFHHPTHPPWTSSPSP